MWLLKRFGSDWLGTLEVTLHPFLLQREPGLLTMKDELEILNQILVGEFIYRFSLGDTWELLIGEYHLSAQSIKLEDEETILQLLSDTYPYLTYSVDKDEIPKATIVAANLRKQISSLSLDEEKNLTIYFEKGYALTICTNVKYVDWQWSINRSGDVPYVDLEVACLIPGELELKKQR